MWVESKIVYLRKIIATCDRMILDKNHQNIFIQAKWVPVLYLRIMTVIDNSLCSSQRKEQSNVFQHQEMAKVQNANYQYLIIMQCMCTSFFIQYIINLPLSLWKLVSCNPSRLQTWYVAGNSTGLCLLLVLNPNIQDYNNFWIKKSWGGKLIELWYFKVLKIF